MARKILVVEDDRNISDLIRMYLEKEGFEVQAAFDGGTAVETFRTMQPDMVLLDIMLPVMDGWAVCSKIRETSRTPIIMITAKSEVFDRIQGLVMGDSDSLTVGDTVYAIGNPLGVELRGTLTDGIVSAINRDVEVQGRTMTLIQTNAALNEGNSGGPLINVYGQVVGVNTIKMMSFTSNVEGLGFALPMRSVQKMVNDILAYGEVLPEPRLGVTVYDLPKELPDGSRGVEVQDVSAGSAADIAGVKAGDVIVSAAGQSVSERHSLLSVRRQFRIGDDLPMTIWRDGEYLDVVLHLDEAFEEDAAG